MMKKYRTQGSYSTIRGSSHTRNPEQSSIQNNPSHGQITYQNYMNSHINKPPRSNTPGMPTPYTLNNSSKDQDSIFKNRRISQLGQKEMKSFKNGSKYSLSRAKDGFNSTRT